MLRLKDLSILENRDRLAALPEGKLLINTINAHSYNTAQKDELFAEALKNGDALIPDGASIVKACRWKWFKVPSSNSRFNLSTHQPFSMQPYYEACERFGKGE